MPANYAELPNLTVQTDGGESLAYRDTGGDGAPIVLLQHFRGNLDNWDPALIDELGADRRVITFDNVGVGGSSGPVGRTMTEMAAGAFGFLDAMQLEKVDLLGFSIGSFVAQEMALTRPSVLNKGRARLLGPQRGAGYAWLGTGGDRSGRKT